MTLTDMKEFLKVDDTADDANITALMTAAEAHIRGAVMNFNTYYGSDDDFTSLADMVEKLMVLELYDKPLDVVEAGYSYPVRSMLAQMQYWKAAD